MHHRAIRGQPYQHPFGILDARTTPTVAAFRAQVEDQPDPDLGAQVSSCEVLMRSKARYVPLHALADRRVGGAHHIPKRCDRRLVRVFECRHECVHRGGGIGVRFL